MRKHLPITLVFLFLYVSIMAQWEADVRISDSAYFKSTSYNNGHGVAANGNMVHAVWRDVHSAGGDMDVYYKRSTDGGLTWGSDIQLTFGAGGNSSMPSIAISGSKVHVVYYRWSAAGYSIFYLRSTDNGATWDAGVQLSDEDIYDSGFPSIAANGDVLHVVWADQRNVGGSDEVYYKSSSDGGTTWGADTRLSNNAGNSFYPSIAVSGLDVHVVWYDNSDGNYEIYYKRSIDGGGTWGSDTRMTNDISNSMSPSIAVHGTVVHIVWSEERDGNPEVYYKQSTDAGATWGADTRLTNNSTYSEHPSIAVSGSIVQIVWEESFANYSIHSMRSTNGGLSWESSVPLSTGSVDSKFPSVAISGSIVHVIWTDTRDGNEEIYYKRNPMGTFVDIEHIQADGSMFSIFPIPASSKLPIQPSLNVVNQIRILDISGKEVMKTSLDADSQIDVSKIENGVYLVQIPTHTGFSVQKLIVQH